MTKTAASFTGLLVASWLWSVQADAQGNHPPANVQDSLALVALYNATNGAEWTSTSDYCPGTRCWLQAGTWVRGWAGIEFVDDLSDRVQKIDLRSNNLVGQIPDEIGDLTALERLILSDNALAFGIPRTISKLTNLRALYLDNNALDEIPDGLFSLPLLDVVSLSNNLLSGPLPQGFADLPSLLSLGLGGNYFEGEIPSQYGNIPTLWSLGLGNNRLSGPIPSSLGDLSNLWSLSLDGNRLEGEIPAEIGQLANLEYLYLSNNQLSGGVPSSLAGLSKLVQARLDRNRLQRLPDLSAMTTLNDLNIMFNEFTFRDIIPNLGAAFVFAYWPQDSVGAPKYMALEEGESTTISTYFIEGTQLQWLQRGAEMPGEVNPDLSILNVTRADSGKSFVARATHPLVPNLVLHTRPHHLLVVDSRLKGRWVVIVEVKDEVLVSHQGGEWEDLRPGTILSRGDEINTGLDSEVVISIRGDGSRLKLGELTLLKIGELTQQKDHLKTRLLLKIAELEAQVTPQKTVLSDFSVSTPIATASVQGTHFAVRHDTTDNRTTVTVADGRVSVRFHDPTAGLAGFKASAQADSVEISGWQTVQVTEAGLGAVEPFVLAGMEVSTDTVTVLTGEGWAFLASGWNGTGVRSALPVDWSAEGGTIDSSGTYVAGDIPGTYTVTAREPNSGLVASAVVHVESRTSVADEQELPPVRSGIGENYPNPFVLSTAIPFSMASAGRARMRAFDMTGRLVDVLLDGIFQPGKHVVTWNGATASGWPLPSGVYFIVLDTPSGRETSKVLLVR